VNTVRDFLAVAGRGGAAARTSSAWLGRRDDAQHPGWKGLGTELFERRAGA
jgi:hypothetical protein